MHTMRYKGTTGDTYSVCNTVPAYAIEGHNECTEIMFSSFNNILFSY